MTGMYATIAILAALTQRDRDGTGQYIDDSVITTKRERRSRPSVLISMWPSRVIRVIRPDKFCRLTIR